MNNLELQPRIIRAGQAPGYCGMSERVFNEHIKDLLTKITIGVQGVGYDRFEIDEALNQYIARYGRNPQKKQENDLCKNERNPSTGCMTEMVSGTSTKESTVSDFQAAQERVKERKQSGSSRARSKK